MCSSLSGYVFQIRLLKNTFETNLDTDLVHEIEIYYDRKIGKDVIKIKHPQRETLWRYLMNTCELLFADKEFESCQKVVEVSPKYSCSVELSKQHLHLQLLKYNSETKVNSDLIHEIEIRLNRADGKLFFKGFNTQVTGDCAGVSTEIFVSGLTSSQLSHILTELVSHIPTVEQVARFNLGLNQFMWSEEYFAATVGKE